ncbi:hypothetical protein PENSPDRAFT_653892 [Peniophora sp. CONT]|nr:hypothetical protein PENSPDRAFT_653892 [Peniophora sp. CONT]
MSRVLGPADYVQLLRWFASSDRPCICRLKALELIVQAGDKHAVQALYGLEVDRVVDALREKDDKGNKVWEFKGRHGAPEVRCRPR